MKPPKYFKATVYRQAPAIEGVAQFTVVGHVAGTHEECWQQGKALVQYPVLQFSEVQGASQVHH